MVSPSRAGKSTYCDEWVRQDHNAAYPRVIVCGDDIRKALHGEEYNVLSETVVFAIIHVTVRAFLNRGFDVIVDETSTSEISIRRLLEIDENAVAITLDTPKEVCIERALKNNQPYLIPVIERHFNNLEKIKQEGGLNKFMNRILNEIKERNNVS
jgi:predicted kinase